MSFVFLSHRGVDKSRLRPLVRELTRRGIPCWLDRPEDINGSLAPGEDPIPTASLPGIRAGSEWPESIDVALVTAAATVVAWSKAWSGERAVLAREHGVAHARHRALQARYYPLFLDAPGSLPADVIAYRVEAADNVQGYDVSSGRQEKWAELAADIESAWMGGWKSVFGASDRDAARNTALLRWLPGGPAVDRGLIDYEILLKFARGTTPLQAPHVVADANRLVIASLGRRPPNEHAYTVLAVGLPNPERSLLDFWSSVFDQAATLGPRMVAALFLAAPPAVTAGASSAFEEIVRLMGDGP